MVEMKIDEDLSGGKGPENPLEIGGCEDLPDVQILMPEVSLDPMKDMTRQLLSNKEKVDRLERQNERLLRTLARLQQYSQTQKLG